MTKTNILKLSAFALLVLAGLGGGTASAQCTSDDDCAEGERCQDALVLVQCGTPPCEEPPPRECVPAALGQACQTDEDCGEGLMCERMLVAIDCPADDPECAPEEAPEGGAEGFCVGEGDYASLAANSGLAPVAASGDPNAPPTAEAGEEAQSGQAPMAGSGAPAPGSSGGEAPASGSSSGGCSVAAGNAGIAQLVWLAMAVVLLRRRRTRA